MDRHVTQHTHQHEPASDLVGRFLAGAAGVSVLVVLAWQWIWWGETLTYQWVDLPQVRAAAQQSDIRLRGLHNSSSPGNPESLYIILHHPQTGDLALRFPTRASFTGGGPLLLGAIGPCGTTPLVNLTDDPVFADLRVYRVDDVWPHYDTIVARVRARGWCFPGSRLSPREP
jgi:hypothetical protein